MQPKYIYVHVIMANGNLISRRGIPNLVVINIRGGKSSAGFFIKLHNIMQPGRYLIGISARGGIVKWFPYGGPYDWGDTVIA